MLPSLLALLSILFVVKRGKEPAIEHSVDVEAFIRVTFEAHLNKIFEVSRPLVAFELWNVHVDYLSDQLISVPNCVVRWHTRS